MKTLKIFSIFVLSVSLSLLTKDQEIYTLETGNGNESIISSGPIEIGESIQLDDWKIQ